MCRKFDFSLIELLITIAIIATLAAMLLPVLNSARTTAKTKICLSTQKQLGVLYFSYMTDYSDLLPPARTCQGTIYWSWWGIRRVVHSYIPYKGGMPAAYKDKVLRCSEGSLRKQDGHTTIDQHYGQNIYLSTFVGASRTHNNCTAGCSVESPLVTKITRPSSRFLLGDSDHSGVLCEPRASKLDETEFYGMRYRHAISINATYVDGHAQIISYRYFMPAYLEGIWSPGFISNSGSMYNVSLRCLEK